MRAGQSIRVPAWNYAERRGLLYSSSRKSGYVVILGAGLPRTIGSAASAHGVAANALLTLCSSIPARHDSSR